MSDCDFEAIEGLLDGTLSTPATSAVAAHLSECRSCARELVALRAEQAAFSAKSRSGPLPIPAFESVLRASRAPRSHRIARAVPAWIAAGLSVAAAVALLVSSGSRVAEASGGACYLADGDGPESSEVAESTEDSRFGECLLASPAPHSRCF